MDINEYMSKSLELQAKQVALLERVAEGIESLNESGIFIANQNDLENAIPVVILGGGVSNVNVETVNDTARKLTGADKKEEPKAQADKPAETVKAEDKPAAEEPKQDKPAEETKKKVTIDDARGALKKFAAIEGNDAAMELLTSLKAKSVSDLAEQGPDALQKLIDKCEGKGE
ncbi:hypothetical protein Xoosp2_7 [Xanthomonas phage Xoo-sp2]|uniref:Uncharacterized protein n=1 Tax=Xanthomonas phage Xoo-sp2 TaxID=1852622 RepID=A0A1X9IAD1_9CAUD|nr:hypothetical protein JTY55_gp07 [Xanthomonas phage Xoo-sp2]ANT45229.1 hypothetical protein Xoosp2_7 [Xanthomonas phage Xoo-sp2]